MLPPGWSVCSEHRRFDDVDQLVLNEGKLTVPRFFKDLEQACAKRLTTMVEFADTHQTLALRRELAELNRHASIPLQFPMAVAFATHACHFRKTCQGHVAVH